MIEYSIKGLKTTPLTSIVSDRILNQRHGPYTVKHGELHAHTSHGGGSDLQDGKCVCARPAPPGRCGAPEAAS